MQLRAIGMTFHIGQKVVCVNAKPTRPNVRVRDLVEGTVYTVRWVGIHNHPVFGEALCLRLVEVVRRCDGLDIDDLPSLASRFRPLVERKTDISCFKALLVPILNTEEISS